MVATKSQVVYTCVIEVAIQKNKNFIELRNKNRLCKQALIKKEM